MIARTAWMLFWLGIAAVTVSIQIDRQSRRAPELATFVPEVLRGFSQAQLTASELDQQDRRAALADARTLVARRPMRAEHLRLFAQANALAGENESAARAIQQAARRGWRDPVTQQAELLIALEAGDGAEAARRLAALWTLSRDQEVLGELTPRVLADQAGSREFNRLLGASERLRRRFGSGVAR